MRGSVGDVLDGSEHVRVCFDDWVVDSFDGSLGDGEVVGAVASSLIASGLSVAAVQAVLGHASPAETLEVYTHLWPTDEDRTREAIAAASETWMRGASAG